MIEKVIANFVSNCFHSRQTRPFFNLVHLKSVFLVDTTFLKGPQFHQLHILQNTPQFDLVYLELYSL